MVPAPQLLQLGMVDEIVEARAAVLPAALEAARNLYLKHPDFGRESTKIAMRSELSSAWKKGIDWEGQQTWDCISREKTVEDLTRVMERLMAAGKKKAAKL